MASCQVLGCPYERLPRSPLCNTHKSAKRRHGDPLQLGITVTDLAPFRKTLAGIIKRNRESPVWAQLDDLWRSLVKQCAADVAEVHSRGAAFVASDYEARSQLARLADVDPQEAVGTILAMFMLRELAPHRLKSDKAFLFQLVRRVRGLSDVNVAKYHDQRLKKDKRVYRDLAPRTTERMATYLVEGFGRAGLHIARREKERVEQEGRSRNALDKALEGLK